MHIRRPLCVFSLLFAAVLVMLLCILQRDKKAWPQDTSLDGRYLSFEGTIKEIKEKNDKTVIQITNISITDSDILFYLSDHLEMTEELHIGSRLRGEGDFRLFDEARNKGQFDSREYYRTRNCGYAVYNGKIRGISASYDILSDFLRRIRISTSKVYEHYFDREEYGVIEALVLADKDKLDEDIKEKYRNAGIMHILALSGLHIVTLGFMLMAGLKLIGFKEPIAALSAITVMTLYCLMTGMPISALRALIMFILSALSMLAGRTYDIMTSAAAASLIMLIMDPGHIRDMGFLLSFSSVIGIGLIYPGIREVFISLFDKMKIRKLHRSSDIRVRLTMSLLRTLLFSVSLQLALAPMNMWFFYQLSVYGIFVNLIAVPLAGVLLFGSIASGILGALATSCNYTSLVLNLMVKPAVYVTKMILRIYDMITQAVCDLPASTMITGRPKLWQMMIYYAFLLTLTVSGYILKRSKAEKEILRKRAAIMITVCITGLGVMFVRTDPDFEISALDVGQGQCFVIHGRDVPALIYDCGSTDVKEVGKYTLIPFLKYNGISRLDTVFISHLDSDHVSGILDLLKEDYCGIKIKRIIISASPVQRTSDNYEKLVSLAALRDIPVYAMRKDDIIRWEGISAECLSPSENKGNEIADINEASLVLSVNYENNLPQEAFSVLFTGDISSVTEEELTLLRIKGNIQDYDYLQVAHHGSRSAADKEFINSISPQIAVISAGRDNRYGHPHKETLKILDEHEGTHTFITSRDGETDCDISGGKASMFLFN